MIADLGPNRLRTLRKLEETLKRGERIHDHLQKEWDEALEFERGDCFQLNIIYSQITVNEETTKALKNLIKEIRLEISN